MDKLKYIKLENEDGSYSSSIPLAVDSDYVDVNGSTLTNELSHKANNSEINNLQNQINELANGSPLVASSVEEMIDTTKIYVNTSDGYWYYYNGSVWNQGGIYQATGIEEDSVDKKLLNADLKNAIYKTVGTDLDISEANIVHLMKQATGDYFISSTNVSSLVVPIEANTTYIVQKVVSQRFTLYLSENYPAVNVTITKSKSSSSAASISITSESNDNYLTIYYYNSNYDTLTEEQIRNSIKVFKGAVETEESYGAYLNKKINNVDKNMLNADLRDAIYKTIGTDLDISIGTESHLIKNTESDTFAGGTSAVSLIMPIEANTKYIVQKVLSTRFALYLSEYYPRAGIDITDYVSNNSQTELEITSGSDDNYLTIYYYNPGSDTLTEEQIRNSLMMYKNDVVEDETQVEYYLNNDIILSNKYIKLFSTKYLGPLTQGYIAISSDDGTNSLADTTVDIFKGYKTTYNKNIPLTMGLMSNSAIFSDTTRKNKVLELIEDYGASVAIHGSTRYTQYSNKELFNFLDEQKEYLTNNLVAPTSIIFPNHEYNETTSTIAGSYYGVCCTGGINTPIKYGTGSCAGPRSNMYTLYRFSLFNSGTTNQKIKDAIDEAYENHMIFLPFFHDSTLVSEYERCKPLLDYCVQYANEKGLTFINVGDIPNIK